MASASVKKFKAAKQAAACKRIRLKKGDTVMVIAGKDKGKTGLVRQVFRGLGKLIVEGLNTKKKAIKANPQQGQAGGHLEMEAPLPVSNVMFFDLKTNQPTRLAVRLEKQADGKIKRIRIAKKTGEPVDA